MIHPRRLSRYALPLLLQLVISACALNLGEVPGADDDNEPRNTVRTILNGWETGNDDFKMVGSLVMVSSLSKLKEGYGLCTGTLIAKNVVLTAAHCVVKADGSQYPVAEMFFTNRSKVDDANVSQFREVTSVRVVSGFNHRSPVGSPDIAVIRLKANLNTGKRPLDGDGILPSSNPVTAVGFGYSGTATSEEEAGVLENFGIGTRRFGKLKVTGREDLNSPDGTVTANAALITEDYTSTLGKPVYQLTCPGDSGGPLFAKVAGETRIVGVVSGGRYLSSQKLCFQKIDSRYSATAPFAAWIKAQSEELSAPGGCRGVDDDEFVTVDGGCRFLRGELTFSRESGAKKFFAGAQRYCEDLEQGGKSDWRLPTEAELKKLPFGSTEKLALDASTPGYQFWTDTKPVRVYIGENSNHGKSYSDHTVQLRNVICVR